jgi:hypothetical protein
MVAIWTIMPTQNTTFQNIILFFLPAASAMGAATNAPIRVPMERRATIVPDLTLLKAGPGLSPKS